MKLNHLSIAQRMEGAENIHELKENKKTISCGCAAMVDTIESADYIIRLHKAAIASQIWTVQELGKIMFLPATFISGEGIAEKVTIFDLLSMNPASRKAFASKFSNNGEGFTGTRPDGTPFKTTKSFLGYLSREITSNENSPFCTDMQKRIIASLPEEFQGTASVFIRESIIKIAGSKIEAAEQKKMGPYDNGHAATWCMTDGELSEYIAETEKSAETKRDDEKKTPRKQDNSRQDNTWKRSVRFALADLDTITASITGFTGVSSAELAILKEQLLITGPDPHAVDNGRVPGPVVWPAGRKVKVGNEVVTRNVKRPEWDGVFKAVYLNALDRFKTAVIENLPNISRGGLPIPVNIDYSERDERIAAGKKYDSKLIPIHLPMNKSCKVAIPEIFIKTRSGHSTDGYFPHNFTELVPVTKAICCTLRLPDGCTPETLSSVNSGLIAQISYETVTTAVRMRPKTDIPREKILGIDVNSATFKYNTSAGRLQAGPDMVDWHEAIAYFQGICPNDFLFNMGKYCTFEHIHTRICAEEYMASCKARLFSKAGKQVDDILAQFRSGEYGIAMMPTLALLPTVFKPDTREVLPKDPMFNLFRALLERKGADGKTPYYSENARDTISHTRRWRHEIAIALAAKLEYRDKAVAWQADHDPVAEPFTNTEEAASILDRMTAAVNSAKQIEEHILSRSLFSYETVSRFTIYAVEDIDFDCLKDKSVSFMSLASTLRQIPALASGCSVAAQEASGTARVKLDGGTGAEEAVTEIRKWFAGTSHRGQWSLETVEAVSAGEIRMKCGITRKGRIDRAVATVPNLLTKVMRLPEVKNTVERLCVKNATPFVSVDPRSTSLTCSACGARTTKEACKKGEPFCKETGRPFRLGERFVCHKCGREINANWNAAINVAGRASFIMANAKNKKKSAEPSDNSLPDM